MQTHDGQYFDQIGLRDELANDNLVRSLCHSRNKSWKMFLGRSAPNPIALISSISSHSHPLCPLPPPSPQPFPMKYNDRGVRFLKIDIDFPYTDHPTSHIFSQPCAADLVHPNLVHPNLVRGQRPAHKVAQGTGGLANRHTVPAVRKDVTSNRKLGSELTPNHIIWPQINI